ncbi:MAG: hypothetical protein LBT90_00465, partial [Holosporaceae bacterium]|nr:hypothetical protein [Holosporaceae bacterium]
YKRETKADIGYLSFSKLTSDEHLNRIANIVNNANGLARNLSFIIQVQEDYSEDSKLIEKIVKEIYTTWE